MKKFSFSCKTLCLLMLSVHILIHFKVMLVTHKEMDMKNDTLRYNGGWRGPDIIQFVSLR